MSQRLQQTLIVFGERGLHTDDPHTRIPNNAFVTANNISFENGKPQKAPGSRRWNTNQLQAGVRKIIDFWVSETKQRVVTLLKDGSVWKFNDFNNESEVTAEIGTSSVINVQNYSSLFIAGEEEVGRDRKVFIFSDNSPPQIISGDSSTRRELNNPTADWAGTNQPFFGIKHRGRVYAFGNKNNPHTVYASLATDNEDFVTTPLLFTIYPGDGERLITGFTFKGRLFVVKYPTGIYALVDSDANESNWYFQKIDANFGAASNNAALNVLNDAIIANSYGSVTSLSAVDSFGDVESGDLLNRLRVEDFIRNEVSKNGLFEREMIYYEDKKQVLISYRSSGNNKNDRILLLDYSRDTPRVSWLTKDQPNSLSIIKDDQLVGRPFYGADDGYIYRMDIEDRNVNGNGYLAELVTPHMDFREADPLGASLVKSFSALEIEYEAEGDFDLNVDMTLDGRFIETQTIKLDSGHELDEITTDLGKTYSEVPLTKQIPINGEGRRIQFRFWNDQADQNFIILSCKVFYNKKGNQQDER